MNRQEALELYEQGPDEWNAWADRMLLEKRELQQRGRWTDAPEHRWNEDTRIWHQRARADFAGHVFDESANFTLVRFPADAVFESAEFRAPAIFHGGQFLGHANFIGATFRTVSNFARARFRDDANFSKATFAEHASFLSTEFHRPVLFNHVTFKADIDFSHTQFQSDATFLKAKFHQWSVFHKVAFSGKAVFQEALFAQHARIDQTEFSEIASFNQSVFHGPFFLTDTSFPKGATFATMRAKALLSFRVRFGQLPIFSAAHFDEPPQFDELDLDPDRLNRSTEHVPRSILPAHWRTLRRLATQGHDHEHELQFFKGEITARRGTMDTPFSVRFWAGWLYELLSDFGLSLTRPLIWLVLSVWLFAGVYSTLSPVLSGATHALGAACISGSGSLSTAALLLSVHKAFPFAGIGSSGKLDELYACLYGVSPANPSPTILAPRIPDSVAVLGVLQFFLSAVLVFLLVLAIRNWFRLR